MPTQGTWIVPPPERIRPNETNVVFGSASKGSSSGTKGTVEYVAKVDGRDQTIKLSYTNPVGSKATSTIETSTAAIEPVTWVTASNFSKAAFDIKLPMEDLDCVDLRNSAMFPDELPHHEDYDQRVRRLAGDTCDAWRLCCPRVLTPTPRTSAGGAHCTPQRRGGARRLRARWLRRAPTPPPPMPSHWPTGTSGLRSYSRSQRQTCRRATTSHGLQHPGSRVLRYRQQRRNHRSSANGTRRSRIDTRLRWLS